VDAEKMTMADQLTSDELRQVLADWISPYPPKQRRKIAGLFEAVIARAEAAEAEAADAILAASDAAQREENAMHALSHFRARVAELEAASELAIDKWADAARSETQLRLDAAEARVAELEAQAAQGWRDFTEHPPIGELIQIVTVIDAVREEPDGLYRIGHTSEWQTWRPAPQETE
jgi:hypothetical protein